MDFIASILESAVIWFIGDKTKKGIFVEMLSCLFWILHVVRKKVSYGILLVAVPTFIIDAIFLFKNRGKKLTEPKKDPKLVKPTHYTVVGFYPDTKQKYTAYYKTDSPIGLVSAMEQKGVIVCAVIPGKHIAVDRDPYLKWS